MIPNTFEAYALRGVYSAPVSAISPAYVARD
jgi:hypothetical protein